MNKLSESIVKSLKQLGVLADKGMDKIEAFGSKLVDKVPAPLQDKVAKVGRPVYFLLATAALTSLFVAPFLTGKLVLATLSFGMFSDSCKYKSANRAREAASNTLRETEAVTTTGVEKSTFKPNAAAPDFKNAVNAEPPEAANNNTVDVKVTAKPPTNG
jgi:hypothetical protein